jgi:hypothetical protein
MTTPSQSTLLDLVQTVSTCATSDVEVVATVAYLINSGRVRHLRGGADRPRHFDWCCSSLGNHHSTDSRQEVGLPAPQCDAPLEGPSKSPTEKDRERISERRTPCHSWIFTRV